MSAGPSIPYAILSLGLPTFSIASCGLNLRAQILEERLQPVRTNLRADTV